MRLTCDLCKHWVRVVDDTGACHRYPPTVTGKVMSDAMESWDVYLRTVFPITQEEDWCGEHSETPRNG
jgi:hypothetical protein